MCSFIAFVSRTECQASRISLCRHADDLPTISTLAKSIWWLWHMWCLANKEFSSNVAMAFACSLTHVGMLARLGEAWHSVRDTNTINEHIVLPNVYLRVRDAYCTINEKFLRYQPTQRGRLRADRSSALCLNTNPYKPYIFWKLNNHAYS